MRKRLVTMMVVALLLVTSCGKSSDGPQIKEDIDEELATAKTTTSISDPIKAAEAEGKNVDSASDSHSTIEVDENLLTVEVSIPATFVGEDISQDDVDASVENNGYISGELNSDGSVTYVMTKGRHEKLVADIKNNIDTQMNELIGSEDYPNFVKIEANEDYTNFTITTTSSELGLIESLSTYLFYMYGGMYSAFSGNPVDNIHVDFVNDVTGLVIQSADSINMKSD